MGVSVCVSVGVGICVAVGVGVRVPVGVGVCVAVGVGVGVNVVVAVEVLVGVGVSVAVEVGVDVNVAVGVGVKVAVAVEVLVGVDVCVAAGVSVLLGVVVGVSVAVGNNIYPMGPDSEHRSAIISSAIIAPITGNREDGFSLSRMGRATVGISTCEETSRCPSKAARSWETVRQRLVVCSSIALRTVASVWGETLDTTWRGGTSLSSPATRKGASGGTRPVSMV